MSSEDSRGTKLRRSGRYCALIATWIRNKARSAEEAFCEEQEGSGFVTFNARRVAPRRKRAVAAAALRSMRGAYVAPSRKKAVRGCYYVQYEARSAE